MKSDNYIIVTGSHNLNDDDQGTGEVANKEKDDSSRRVLEEQGIFLDQESSEPKNTDPSDEFTKQLQEIGGIEIIKSEEGEY